MKILSLLLIVAVVSSTFLLTGLTVEKEGPVRHIVVFKYSPDATEAQIRKVTDAFRALKDEIPGILSFEYGVNNSPEGEDQGFTHVYLVTFESAEARDAYLPHPAHQAFGELLGEVGILEDVFVVDYEVQQ